MTVFKYYYPTLNYLFDELFGETTNKAPTKCECKEKTFSPNYFFKKSKTEYLLQFELAGISKDDVAITVEDGELKISGERCNSVEVTETDVYKSYGIAYGKFEKAFSIGEDVDDSNIKASFDNGLLNVIIPIKQEKELPSKTKQISIS